MHAYGVKRNWNEEEGAYFKNPTRSSARQHRKNQKAQHRKARRTAKHKLYTEVG
jgi:hypothetical protein